MLGFLSIRPFAALLLCASIEVLPASALVNNVPLRKPCSRRGHEVAYLVGTTSPVDVYSSDVRISGAEVTSSPKNDRKRPKLSVSSLKSSVLQKRRMPRPKRLSSNIKVEATATFGRPTDKTSTLLTKDEERKLTNQIRMLRTVIRIRDELVASSRDQHRLHDYFDDWPTPTAITSSSFWQPSEEQWADACGMSVIELRRVMHDGQGARTRMVAANGGLVGSIAKRYLNSVTKANQANGGMGTIISFHDLIQEGNLGLMEAAERFEPERGFRFSTYATWWVRQRMLRAISDYSRTIRLPAHVHSMIRKIQKARKDMEKEIGRTPSIPELAHNLGISAQKLQMYSDSSRSVLSLENPIRGTTSKQQETDKSVTLGEFISSDSPTPDEDAESRSLREVILSVVDELPTKERDVLVARFGLDDGTPKTVDEIAKRIGISRDRVRVVEARALNKLRHPQRNHRLKSYVGGDMDEEGSTANLSPEQIWSF